MYEELDRLGATIIDATCPNVKRIHELAAECAARGEYVLVAGDKSHPEVQGILAYAGKNCSVFGDSEELEELLRKNCENYKKGVAILSQTTYNIELWEECVHKAMLHEGVKVYNTVCNATTRRQTEAQSCPKAVIP